MYSFPSATWGISLCELDEEQNTKKIKRFRCDC